MVDGLSLVKEVGAFRLSTSETLEHGLFQLTEDLGSHSHNSLDLDQLREMLHFQGGNPIHNGHLVKLDIGLLDDILELR